MLRRATLLLLLLLPRLALAQLGSLGTVTALVSTEGTSGQANRAECQSSTSTASWTFTFPAVTPSAGDKWRLITSSGTCATTLTQSTSGVVADPSASASATTQLVPGISVATMASKGGVTSCTQALDATVYLCVYQFPSGSTVDLPLASQGTFNFQMAIPPAPVITGVSPGDSQLSVAVTPGTKTATEQADTGVTYSVTCSAPGATTSTATGNAGNIVCAGLTNGIAYTVTAIGISAAGNSGVSTASWPAGVDTTPLPFEDFWTTYKAAGGIEQGGCGTGGAGALAPALALVALLAARRRRP